MATFERALIVGASSGMGEAIARRLAANGCRVALVARREGELARIAGELNARRPDTACYYAHDATDFDSIPALFQTVCRDLGGLDLFVYAAGVMPRIEPDEYDFSKDQQMIAVNVLGLIAWGNQAARRFAVARGGTLVGLGSVAGDRGRRGQPVYCASKAAVDTYLEGLRNRLARLGVHVVTIKPGPVDTPMTRGLGKLPLLIPADVAAAEIVAAAEAGRTVAYVPWQWRTIMGAIRAVPSALFQRLNI